MLDGAYVIAYFDGDGEVQCLSNFAYTPFILDELEYRTVEAFWQCLKFEDPIYRDKIRLLPSGVDAKQAGRFAPTGSQIFEYMGKLYKVGSESHHLLLERAIRAKTAQNDSVRKSLLETKDANLLHLFKNKYGNWRSGDSPALPAIVFENIWKKIRSELQNNSFLETQPLPPALND